jgi:hypothetical protein
MLIFYIFIFAMILICCLAQKCAGEKIHFGTTWKQNEYLNYLEKAAWKKVGLGDKYNVY